MVRRRDEGVWYLWWGNPPTARAAIDLARSLSAQAHTTVTWGRAEALRTERGWEVWALRRRYFAGMVKRAMGATMSLAKFAIYKRNLARVGGGRIWPKR